MPRKNQTFSVTIETITKTNAPQQGQDQLAVEEPLEIRIEGRSVAVTMRTPGNDLDLAAGFLFTEKVIDGWDDVHAMKHVDSPFDPQGNTVDVVLSSGVPAMQKHLADRTLFASSSCGVCGKSSIERIFVEAPPLMKRPAPDPHIIFSLGKKLNAEQKVFSQTGGLHAAGLFDFSGNPIVVREDIGRHNAVDKVIGHMLRNDQVPVEDHILLVSGRAGFEIVQKALVARIPVVAAIGPPSSLAAQLASKSNIHLIGFLRNNRYNIYEENSCGPSSISSVVAPPS